MPLFNSAEIKMSSGAAGTNYQFVERVQSISFNYAPPRTAISHLGRYKALNQRPVVNYTPVSLSVEAIKSSKEIETNFGLINNTGVGIVFGGNSNSVDGFGCRNFEILIAQPNASIYQNGVNIYSGCLTSYSVSASVGEPARTSFAVEGLDMVISGNNSLRNSTDYESRIIKPEDVIISGIEFSGFGVTGVVVQSLNLGLNLGRQSLFKLGTKFPDRPVTEINATVSINGFIEGLSYLSGLSSFDCGNTYTGSFFFTLSPSCYSGTNPNATTYVIVNPTLDSFNLGASVGSFVSVDLSFSAPISINSGEGGSNLIIR
jgi:hypothetical protein